MAQGNGPGNIAMTEQNSLSDEELILIGNTMSDAWDKPCGDKFRQDIVRVLLDMSVAERAFVVCWAYTAQLGKPCSQPRKPGRAAEARLPEVVAAISQRPAIFLVQASPFFSPRHFAAGARHLAIRGPRAAGPGTSRWPRKPKAEAGRAALA